MSVLSWPDHLLSLPEWENLPEDSPHRLEVVEGILLVSPRPMPFHQRAVSRLDYLINEQLPPELCAFPGVEVILAEEPLTIRAPDVLVTSTAVAEANPARFRPQDVVLAVEVLSTGSVRTDRVTKFAEYAEAGIVHYWIVDLTPPANLLAYRVIDGVDELSGEYAATSELDLDGTAITLDLDALTATRAQRL
jgi:Uma2 family endonuclease